MDTTQPRPSPLRAAAPIAAAFFVGVGLSYAALRLPQKAPEPVAALAVVDPAPTASVKPFGALPEPKPVEAPPPAPLGLSDAEKAKFVEAAGFYRKNLFPQGDASAAGVTDPLARAALDWVALRVSPTPARLDAFEKAHPDWPLRDWRRAVREGWLFTGKPSPAETLATLGDAPPVTSQGSVALARAQLSLGNKDGAEKTIRALWRDGDLDTASETAITKEFGVLLTREDHRARASRLTYAERGGAAWRAAALAGPDVLALTTARLEAARGPLTARAINAVPPALRADPGFIFAHVQDSRRSARLDEALAWLKQAPSEADKLIDPDKWWTERRMIARMLLDRGQTEKAYAVAAEAVTRASPSRVDSAWLAGWIALRFLNDPLRAAPHFAAAAAAAETPISIARANYWRGRAAEALKLPEAHEFYVRAAAYPIAYYGQLAARKLGAEQVTLRRPLQHATGDERAEATRVIELYLDTGLDDFVGPVAYDAAKTWKDDAQLGALAEVLRAKASASTNVVFGKLAIERGQPLDAVAFPTFGLPEFQPLPGSAGIPQVMAVARQESEFLPRAASGVGAKGLMQVMPATAADTARKAGVPYDFGRLVGDPAYNMQLGAAFLGQVLSLHGGSLEMAAAAYNAGAGAVARWVNIYGDPRNGADLVDWVERIPYDETRDYVMRVAENYGVYQARLAEAPEPRAGTALARR